MLGFTGSPLDRAEALRRDPARLAAAMADPTARWLWLDELKPVMDVAGPAPTIAWHAGGDRDAAVLLGFAEGIPHLAAPGQAVPPFEPIDARTAALTCPAADAAMIAQGRSLIDWHARNRFCARCGAATTAERGGQLRRCPACRAEHYPRTDPVVIMLVVHGDRALLGRGPRMPAGFVSALAGFVEPGESLEEAVRREVMEEAGVPVGDVRYVASQPWPFPSSLMIGCHADALATDLVLDPAELDEARWATREECVAALAGAGRFALPPPLAIAHHLVQAWVGRDAAPLAAPGTPD